jgi:hypothetical protein
MRHFTNPLENIRIASPCPANWDEMFGDDRKRHCGSCKLNVYNLSDMTRREAENLLINSEGRLCVRFFRRSDGTILTKNCPVGWAAVKQRVSHVATAAFSMMAGLFGGIFAFNLIEPQPRETNVGVVSFPTSAVMGDVDRMLPIQGGINPGTDKIDMDIDPGIYTNGRVTLGQRTVRLDKPRRK